MTTATKARTARIPHLCDGCHWTDFRGRPSIAPGHRYLIHTAFPGGPTDEINQSDRPYTNKECIACADERDDTTGLLVAAACSTSCCSMTPCARPHRHDGNHSCRECSQPSLPSQPDGIQDDSRDLPDPVRAAERISAYISAVGDGLYDVCDGAPLYGRDLEAVVRAVTKAVTHA